jgi:hypothetical protein
LPLNKQPKWLIFVDFNKKTNKIYQFSQKPSYFTFNFIFMKKIITIFFIGFFCFQQANAARYFDIEQTSGQNIVGNVVEFLAIYYVTPPYPASATAINWTTDVSITINGGNLISSVTDCGYNPCPGGIITIEITSPNVIITVNKTSAPTASSSFSFTALPIELTKFEAKSLEKQVNLTWTTTSETNNREFGIEQSWDGKNWKTLGTKAGAGTTRDEQNYQFTDFQTGANPLAETAFYRLRTTDFDGQESHSEMISVKLKTDVSRLEFGTIAADLLRFKSPNEENVQVSWFNFNGQLMYQKSMLAQKGFNEMTVDQDIPNGLYVIRMLSATQSAVLKVKI